ncbi:hypothetical protein BDZ97DRAFT_1795167 [Flammula alnicola]|nr:hypothetical protein BDZ97DRAFT_1795167 [Flammula alnicola]
MAGAHRITTTPNYVDDVLHAKISNLVSGSIRRAAVEKEPSITYEDFVNELDTGDSFTTSLVDILVKTHPQQYHDRRLIAERTIRSLRQLASNSRSFPSRIPGRTHTRRANLTEYFTASPNEMELEEDDDDYEVTMENPTTIEGARVNSDLYEAFATSPWPPSAARRITASPPASDEWPLPPPLRSPTSTTRPWSAPSAAASASNLTRQASIRRAARSRMVDFHDFTHRRRSNIRDSLAASRSDAPETVTEPREGLASQTVRRFFPFPRTRRHGSTTNPWSELSDNPSPDSDEPGPVHYYTIDPSLSTWYEQNPVPDPLRASPDVESREETENLLRAPRLRRGGIRAPESILSRHASPVTINTPPTTLETTTNTDPTTPAPPARDDDSNPAPASEEPVGYPTPGSTENEHIA